MTRAIAIISCLFAVLFLSFGSEEGGEVPDFGCEAYSDVECVVAQSSVSKFKGLVNPRTRCHNLSRLQHLAATCRKSVAAASACPFLAVRLVDAVLFVRTPSLPARILYCVFRE